MPVGEDNYEKRPISGALASRYSLSKIWSEFSCMVYLAQK